MKCQRFTRRAHAQVCTLGFFTLRVVLTFTKLFKATIFAINHRKIERQLLIKSIVQTTIRLAFNEAFKFLDLEFTKTLQTL